MNIALRVSGCLAFLLAGCEAVVVEPSESSESTPDDPTESAPVSEGGIAVRLSQLRPDVDASNETLVLMFGSQAVSCEDPHTVLDSCTELQWYAEIALPVELQYAGATLEDIGRLKFLGYHHNFDSSWGNGSSCGAGGGYLWGQIDVLAIDDQSVTFRYESPVDEGTRVTTVMFCDVPHPQVATAVVLGDARTSEIYGEGRGSGWQHIFVDASAPALGLSCSEPFAHDLGCDIDRRVVRVSLAPSAQTLGVHPIGPDVAVVTSQSGPAGELHCYHDMGDDWTDGTVEVVAIDDQNIQVRVQSSSMAPFEASAGRCLD